MQSFLKFLMFSALLVFLIPANLYRAVFFNVLVEVSFFVYIYLLVNQKIKPPKFTWILATFSIFTLVSGLAAAFSLEPTKSFWGTPLRSLGGGLFAQLHYFLFFIILASVFDKKEEYLKLLKFFVLIGTAITSYGLFERFYLGQARVDSLFGNPIYFGVFSLFVLFSNIYFLLTEKGLKIFYSIAALTAIGGVYLSLSRGPLLGLGIAVLISLPFLISELFKKIKTRYPKFNAGIASVAIIFFLILLFVGSYQLLKDNYMVRRFENLFKMSTSDASALNRLASWKIALKAVKDRPILGWGQENFDLAYYKHYDPQFLSNISDETWFDRAHNNFLDIASTVGLAGVVAYLFIWFAAAMALFILFRRGDKKEGIVCSALLIAYFISSIFFFDSIVVFLPFILVLAFISLLSSGQDIAIKIGWLKKSENRKAVIGAVFVLAAIGIFVNFQIAKASFYYYKIKFDKSKDFNELVYSYEKISSIKPAIFEAEANYSFARIITKNKIDDNDLGKYAKKSSEKLNKLAGKHLLDIRPYYYGAQVDLLDFNLNENSESLAKAKNLLEKAIKIAPNRQDLYMDLAQIEMSGQDYQSAILNMEKARDLNPSYYKPHFYLSVLYALSGQSDLVEKEFGITRDVIGINYEKEDIDNMIFLADYFINYKNYLRAIDILESVLRLDGGNIPVRKKVVALYAEIGHWEPAKRHAEIILGLVGESGKNEVGNFLKYLESKMK